jgi:hypothetical protein
MITRLNRLTTGISIIQEIPTVFFRELENAVAFGNHLFPAWADGVFGATSLNNKFEAVYNKYKAIKNKANRDKIIAAFTHNNQIENLCNNQAGSLIIELTDLPKSIRKELDTLFLHLYNSAINYHLFETHVTDTLKSSIDRFITTNGIEVCPFCGLEGFLNIEGQSRIALDHWLCKDLFPMSAVNFDNLFPIGSKCNERPAKGSKNILIDNPVAKNRIQAFYPYLAHNGITTSFIFINEPTIAGISDADWNFTLTPRNAAEQNIFDSWNSTLNISIRYLDYHRKNIFPMWEADYKRFIEDDHDIDHAQTIDELRNNFRLWKASFPIKGRPGAIVYRSFIDNLINNASNPYLFGLCENFRR